MYPITAAVAGRGGRGMNTYACMQAMSTGISEINKYG